jgi:hypothetical protein
VHPAKRQAGYLRFGILSLCTLFSAVVIYGIAYCYMENIEPFGVLQRGSCKLLSCPVDDLKTEPLNIGFIKNIFVPNLTNQIEAGRVAHNFGHIFNVRIRKVALKSCAASPLLN